MKIGFHVSELCPDRPVGTTRFTKELARRLPEIGKKHTWHYFAPCLPRGVGLTSAMSAVKWWTSPWPRFWTQSRLPFDLYRCRPDVLLMPIQQLPYLRPARVKTIAVVHDLAFHHYPQMFSYKDWVLQHTFTSYAVRQADHLITVSQATANDVETYYGRTDNVHVIHHGVDHDMFRLPSDQERREGWRQLKLAYGGLKKPYILYVGQMQPRKNIERLIDAFEIMTPGGNNSPVDTIATLAISSGYGWLEKDIRKKIRTSAAADRIQVLGRVPDKLLAPLYRHAEVFVLPSLYEGFGMPILEAMASGCPVVTSDVSSMPEVAGGAAVLVDPHKISSIAGGIAEARGKREELSRLGVKRAGQFSWETTAQKTLDVILAAASD